MDTFKLDSDHFLVDIGNYKTCTDWNKLQSRISGIEATKQG